MSKDDESPKVDQRKYRYMIGGLLYLTTTRPYIMHAVFLVAKFQEDPQETYIGTIKRIFKYLKCILDYVLWYPKDIDFTLSAYIVLDWIVFFMKRKV